MRLLEAIFDANQRLGPDRKATLDTSPFPDSLPLVVLTCIDVRLNHLFPGALGVREEDFIWLRNAGNIIFDPLSSMTRTLALACAVKSGREIAIIGHTDCKVRATSVSELIDRFRALGIERSHLPDNLVEFFGLFASERQNVMNAAAHIRQSPLISPKVPVHGLLIDTLSGRLEWVVNGYETLDRASVQTPFTPLAETKSPVPIAPEKTKPAVVPPSAPEPPAPPKLPELPPQVRRFLGMSERTGRRVKE